MKIGVLGGSFDPPHKGHLRIARLAEKKMGLDLLLFVPCQSHSLKGHLPVASAFHRCSMTALATDAKSNWLVEPIELTSEGNSYTFETLKSLQKKYVGAGFFLLMGEDAYGTFDKWREPEKIIKMAKLVVFPREIPSKKGYPKNVVLIDAPVMDVASGSIRKLIASGKSVKKFLPPAVQRYIEKQGLYLSKREV